jgi:hypothetical protein
VALNQKIRRTKHSMMPVCAGKDLRAAYWCRALRKQIGHRFGFDRSLPEGAIGIVVIAGHR